MRLPNDRDLLEIWEAGSRLHDVGRGVTVLEFGYPELTRDQVLALSVGQGNQRLIEWRSASFGPTFELFDSCPLCGTEVQVALETSDLLASSGEASHAADDVHELDLHQHTIRFRVPRTADLATAARSRDVASARLALLESCVLEAIRDGASVPTSDLPDTVVEALSEDMAKRDPLAEMRLDVLCPECEGAWALWLDVVPYLWEELSARALRVIDDVVLLAGRFGWEEERILEMSPVRRQRYLELSGS